MVLIRIDYVNFRPNRATEWDSTPKRCSRASSLDAPLLGEADGAVAYHSENFQSAASPDAAAIGGAREGMPRQSRIFRIASGGLIAARILMGPEHLGHSRTSTENAVQKLSPRIIPWAGWSTLPGRTSHFRKEINRSRCAESIRSAAQPGVRSVRFGRELQQPTSVGEPKQFAWQISGVRFRC